MTIRISLTMIVKNEAANLPACLASVRDLVDEIIVVQSVTRYASPFQVLTGVELFNQMLEDLS